MSEPVKHPLKLSYCYAHEDKVRCNTLDKHLSSIKHEDILDIRYMIEKLVLA